MTKEEAMNYSGGAGFSASFLNATTQFLKALYGFGQNLGSSIMRNIRGITC